MSVENVLAIQTEIVETVVDSVRAVVTPEELALIESQPTESLDAFNNYLLGRHFLNQRAWLDPSGQTGVDNIRTALSYFEQALAADSGYALAWSGLSDALALGLSRGPAFPELSREESLERAEQAARKAIDIDPSLSEGHTSLALALTEKWDWIEAEQEFQRSIALSPGYPAAHHWYALLLVGSGRVEEALREIRLAQNLDPVSPVIGNWVGLILNAAGRTAEAGEQYRRVLEVHPDVYEVRREIIVHFLRLGEFEQAADYLEPLVEGVEGVDDWSENLRIPEKRTSTLRAMAELARYPHGPDLAALAGDKAYALELLERGLNGPVPFGPDGLAVHVLNPELRSEPLFRQALEDMGVEW
jgi:tetratricopeptide (TPR) repeat protein